MLKDNWEKDAEQYEDYAQKYPMYRESIRRLIDLLDIKNKIVIDLACGTGISTEEILKHKPKKIIGIDFSENMLNIAKRKIKNKNVEFVLAKTEEFSTEKVEVIICNFALWQFDLDKAIKNINNHLKKGGVFAFSLGGQSVILKENNTAIIRINEMIQRMAKEEGIIIPTKKQRRMFRKKEIVDLIKSNRFILENTKIVKLKRSIEDYFDFIKMRGMGSKIIPNLDQKKRLEIFEKAFELVKLEFKDILNIILLFSFRKI